MAFKDTWQDIIDGESKIVGEDINNIARAIIDIEERGNGEKITIDSEVSDTSTNPVQNKVIKSYIDESIQTAILDSWEVGV